MTLLLNWGVHQLMKKYFFKFNYNKNLFRMDLGSEKGSDKKVKKTKTLIVKDLEGLRVVPPGLEPGTK